MRFRLRTLLIVLALGPWVLACIAPRVIEWLTPRPRVILAIDPSESMGLQESR